MSSSVVQVSRPTISISIPVFNEVDNVALLIAAIDEAMTRVEGTYEIVFVDDGSRDGTFEALRSIADTRDDIRVVKFSRNMGHQQALLCGMQHARGDAVIVMDGDLQHPPSLIPLMVSKWREGFKVVNMVRRRTEDVSKLKWLMSNLFYIIFNRISSVQLTPAAADFRLLDRRCVNALLSMTEHTMFFRGMVSYIGYQQTEIEFDAPARMAGTESYTIRKSLRLASDGIFSFSSVAVKIPIVLGLCVLAVFAIYLLVSFALIVTGVTDVVKGWMSLVALITLSTGVQLLFTGVLGIYISKIFQEVKRRPAYFVEDAAGFRDDANMRRRIHDNRLP